MTQAQDTSPTKQRKLSACVRQLGYTESPLPLGEWLKLRETILSGQAGDIPKRINLPPVILCCDWCGKAFEREAFEMTKHLNRNCQDAYCSMECSSAHHAIKNRRLCKVCGKPVVKKTRRYCEECRPPHAQRKAPPKYPPIEAICPMCNGTFMAQSRGKGKYAAYCSRTCANRAHSRLMSAMGNPKWKHGSTPLRQQPHSAKAFRQMRPLVRERDGHACVVCKATKRLHVHHIDNWPMNNAASNLVTLCAKCHSQLHAAMDSKPSRILWPWLSAYASRPLYTTSK